VTIEASSDCEERKQPERACGRGCRALVPVTATYHPDSVAGLAPPTPRWRPGTAHISRLGCGPHPLGCEAGHYARRSPLSRDKWAGGINRMTPRDAGTTAPAVPASPTEAWSPAIWTAAVVLA
jgi:hypothetical protein